LYADASSFGVRLSRRRPDGYAFVMPDRTPSTARRSLHFDRIDDALADVDRLAAADAAGTLTSSGRWTFGQSLNHLATWADYSYDETPLAVPLPVRLFIRLLKRPILYKPMRPGSRIPRVPGGTLGIDPASSADGLAHFRRSFLRLRDQPPTRPHWAFGLMTHAEWTALHLRHCELHLSFFRPA
jgi:hypothetical protein